MRASPWKQYLRLCLPFTLILAALFIFWFIDTVYLRISNGAPNFGILYIVRSVSIAILSVSLVLYITKSKPVTGNRIRSSALLMPATTYGVIKVFEGKSRKRSNESMTLGDVNIWLIIVLSASFLILFLINPRLFSKLSREDHVIEWLSALFLFVAGGLFVAISVKIKRLNGHESKLHLYTALLFSITFFLLGLEEVSWFQRILSFETPEAFGGNWQGEFNIHNFATGIFGKSYLVGAFVVLVFVPFCFERFPAAEESPFISVFMPSRLIVFSGSIASAYNYHNWDALVIQLSFFITLFILLYYAWVMRSSHHRYLLTSLVGVIILTQALFLANGSQFVRNYDVAEYREFFIPLTFVLYSLEVLYRTHRSKRNRGLTWSYSSGCSYEISESSEL